MTYGFRPENWPAFQHELEERGIAVTDIEKVEMRPQVVPNATDLSSGMVDVVVTLRSGRVEFWRHRQAELP
jgi:hypothetical protein